MTYETLERRLLLTGMNLLDATGTLPEGIGTGTPVVVGDKAIFFGFDGDATQTGFGPIYLPSPYANIYDAATQTWSSQLLSAARFSPLAFAIDKQAVIASGAAGANAVDPSIAVDIYNNATGQWSSTNLSSPRSAYAVVGDTAVTGGRARGRTPSGTRPPVAALQGNNILD